MTQSSKRMETDKLESREHAVKINAQHKVSLQRPPTPDTLGIHCASVPNSSMPLIIKKATTQVKVFFLLLPPIYQPPYLLVLVLDESPPAPTPQ